MKLIDKDALVAEIERLRKIQPADEFQPKEQNKIDWLAGKEFAIITLQMFLDNLESKEVDLEKEIDNIWNPRFNLGWDEKSLLGMNHEGFATIAEHFFQLGLKAQHDNWKVVDNINPQQADKNKIYCVFTKDRYILAKVINHPKDEELLQWKCTEFPHHRYDMCEGDKFIQIV